MHKNGLRFFAAALGLSMVLGSAAPASAIAAEDNKITAVTATQNKKEPVVLELTDNMLDKNGNFTYKGSYDVLVIPKELKAAAVNLNNCNAQEVQVESGTTSTIQCNGGSIGTLSVIPVKYEEIKIDDIRSLLADPTTSSAASKLYLDSLQKKKNLQSRRPKIIVTENTSVGTVDVSGSAKLDLTTAKVDNVSISTDSSAERFTVDLENYEGDLSVKQSASQKGNLTAGQINLKNTKVDNLAMEGAGKGNVLIAGKESEIGTTEIKDSASLSLCVDTSEVYVSEDAKNVKLDIVGTVQKVEIKGESTSVNVAPNATVNNLDITGSNSSVIGSGKVKQALIKAENVSVGTSGTSISGKNNYVAPPATPSISTTAPVKEVDLGGMEIIIGANWASGSEQDTEYQKALYEYRQEMMKKYNFTIRQEFVMYYGDDTYATLEAAAAGNPNAHLYMIDPKLVEVISMHPDWFYDLSTLSPLNFNESKWNTDACYATMRDGKILGMAPMRDGEIRHGVFFNKKLLEKAGIDPNLPYDLQAKGEWTWATFEDLCAKLKAAGVGPIAVQNETMLTSLIFSTGTTLVSADENGKYHNNLNSPAVRSALEFAQSLYDKGYAKTAPDNAEELNWEYSWDWYYDDFNNEGSAFMFSELWTSREFDMTNMGFVACPRAEGEANYHTGGYYNIVVIPSCYDKETAEKIAFAYNIWASSPSGYEGTNASADDGMNSGTYDSRTAAETLPMLGQKVAHLFSADRLVQGLNVDDLHYSYPFIYYDEENDWAPSCNLDYVVSTISDKWDMYVDMENKILTRSNILQYEIRTDGEGNEYAAVTGSAYLESGDVVIPSEYNGLPVKEINWWAFAENGTLTSVTIPDSVLWIQNNAFNGCWNLSTITLPDTLEYVGEFAFKNTPWQNAQLDANGYAVAGKLLVAVSETAAKITIPETVQGIGACGFYGAAELTELVIPDTVNWINEHAFLECKKLEKLVIPASIWWIGDDICGDSDALKYIFVEKGSVADDYFKDFLTENGYDHMVFYSNEDATSAEYFKYEQIDEEFEDEDGEPYTISYIVITGYNEGLPKNVVVPSKINGLPVYEIQDGAFKDCSALESITLPDCLISICNLAFYNANALSEVSFSDKLKKMESGAFTGTPWLDKQAEDSENHCYIFDDMTYGITLHAVAKDVTEFTIPDEVQLIGCAAFHSCSQLTELVIPDATVAIDDSAFYNCASLQKITIPASVEVLGANLFEGCTNLTEIITPADSAADKWAKDSANGYTGTVINE